MNEYKFFIVVNDSTSFSGFSSLATLLAFMGKIGISMAFCVCWMHAAEMYPTSIRSVDGGEVDKGGSKINVSVSSICLLILFEYFVFKPCVLFCRQ